MVSSGIGVREYAREDAEPVFALRRLSFGGPRIAPQWVIDHGGWYGFVAEDPAAGIAGFLRVQQQRQFFGGRAVPMGGVAGVCVAPYARGHGVAGRLLRTAIEAMRERGQAIATLFGSAPALYRSCGWEHCGVGEKVGLTPEFCGQAGKPLGTATLRPARDSDVDNMRRWYTEFAATVDGMLERDEVAYPPSEVRSADLCELVEGRGYLTARRETDRWLEVRDFVARDRDAALAMLDSLAHWSGRIDEIQLPVLDPAVHDLVLGRPEFCTVYARPWMLRVVDLERAVAARGWPAASVLRPGAVDLEITDELAPWQAGRYRLAVDGEVWLERGGTGAVRLSARGLAAWFSGVATMDALRRYGLAAGGPEHDALLDALTGAPKVPRLGNHRW